MITDTKLLMKVVADLKSRGATVVLQAALLNHSIGYDVVATFAATNDYKAETLSVTVCHNLNEGPD